MSTPLDHSIRNPISSIEVPPELSENIILTSLDDIYNWARVSSIYPLLYGTACCFIEFAAMIASRFDMERFGMFPRASPRQADLIILAGTLTMQMAVPTRRLYDQMPEPKYVIAMGACMITGGMFSTDSPTALRGADKLLPIDVYIPGCPPRPEAILDAVTKLRKKIANESPQERQNLQQTHRLYSIAHQMRPAPPLHTGKYLLSETRQQPPQALAEVMGMDIPAFQSPEQQELLLQSGQQRELISGEVDEAYKSSSKMY